MRARLNLAREAGARYNDNVAREQKREMEQVPVI
jgi:hypothetical protein